MNVVIRNILAVLAGIFIGSAVNMALIMVSGHVIPPPAGVNPENAESLKANIHLFEPKHFLFPFLAHALGTFAGAIVAAIVAANQKMLIALIIGAVFLVGGVSMVFMIPAPKWFIIADLSLAYIPMAWIAGKIAGRI